MLGTAHLFEAIRHCTDVRAVINVTSDKCYQNQERLWGYREDEPLGGRDPYSASKACAELVGAAMRSSFFPAETYGQHGVAVASARAGNAIGGGDMARDRLIPDILAAFSAGTSVVIRSPGAVRPWQHVLEALCGYIRLAERLCSEGMAFAEAWNFGPRDEDAKPVQWIVENLTAMWGHGAHWALDSAKHPHEAHYLKLDCSKAKARLHWQPRWNLQTALEHIVDWHQHFFSNADMRVLSLQQICQYTNHC